jgi:hypothetical protein
MGARYVDNGCKYHPKCSDCPEPVCIEDISPNSRIRHLRMERNMAIRQASKLGMDVANLSFAFSLGKRTIRRILKEPDE